MKTAGLSRVAAIAASVSLLTGFAVITASGQPRPAAGPRTAAAGAKVVIHGIKGLKSNDREKTPSYRTSSPESQSRGKYWGCITVEYETSDDWTDELEFNYFALVKDTSAKTFLLFTKTVTYIEIAKGKHVSTVFVRPNTLERYGEMERAAVEVKLKGQRVAMASIPPVEGQPWWQVALVTGQVKVMENMIMNRAETPFAFVAYENYETIK